MSISYTENRRTKFMAKNRGYTRYAENKHSLLATHRGYKRHAEEDRGVLFFEECSDFEYILFSFPVSSVIGTTFRSRTWNIQHFTSQKMHLPASPCVIP